MNQLDRITTLYADFETRVQKSISNFFNDHPEMNHSEINEKLHYIGWDGIEMNYHTLELAKAWYERCPDTSGPQSDY